MASKIDEKTLKKEGVCAASLPTTMGIVAGLLVQNTLKYLLKFGSVTPYLGYNALDDFFPTYPMKPNPECEESFCRRRQEEKAEAAKNQPVMTQDKVDPSDEVCQPLHEDNEWQISLVDDSSPAHEAEERSLLVAPGLKFAYETKSTSLVEEDNEPVDVPEQDLETLMARMRNMSWIFVDV